MRKRTAKQLGTRHDRNYFKMWTRQKRWLVILALLVPVIFLGWLGTQAVRGENTPYSSGKMSRAHAVLSKQCSTCHANFVAGIRVGGFRKHAADQACLTCHEAPAHHTTDVTFTPDCGSCHVEHVGSTELARTSDQSCTQCHGDLKSRSGQPHFERAVFSFGGQHPEFASVKAGDPGKVAFNHALHMKPNLLGPPGAKQVRVQLECSDCHRSTSEADGPWRFGSAQWQKLSGEVPPRHADQSYMAAVTFDKHCIGCHVMPFDRQVAANAPHVKPEDVRTFVAAALKDYLAKNPSAWKMPDAQPQRRIPGVQSVALTTPRNADEWLRTHIAEDETLLWGKTCRQCHQFSTKPAAEVPQVVPAALTQRWYKHAFFDHSAHAAVRCDSCHEKALNSEQTSDVLVPGIETCRSCHSGKSTGSADSGYFECHHYHDWKQRKPFKPVYSIPQMTGQD